MRVFDVCNKSRSGAFIMARDQEDAVSIAIAIGHMKAPNAKPIIELTDRFLGEPGIKELMDAGFRGRLMKQLNTYTFEEVVARSGKPEASGKWLPMVFAS